MYEQNPVVITHLRIWFEIYTVHVQIPPRGVPLQLRSGDVLRRVATWVLRNGGTLQPLPRSYCVGTRQRGAMLQRSHAVTLWHSTWMATAALRCSCHHGTYLLEYAEVTSIKCTAADDRLTLPGSERHRTVEVELQSTTVTIKCCQASKRRCTALSLTLTELCGRPIIASIFNFNDRDA